ncbi:hypothetical protein DFH27DRAFT_526788 [Peziza echinospora]|nr:hypothetical protein DFH27DRAFT_526788 [Peziza echinospora]
MALPSSWGTSHPSSRSSFPYRPPPPPPPPSRPAQIDPLNPNNITHTSHLVARLSPKLTGDKILLPHDVLEELLASARTGAAVRERYEDEDEFGSGGGVGGYSLGHIWSAGGGGSGGGGGAGGGGGWDVLPHPIVFRIENPRNGRHTHAVPREFSAESGEVVVSRFLGEVLGLGEEEGLESHPPRTGEDGASQPPPTTTFTDSSVTIVFKPLPKGTYVRLRPLEAGYEDEDWKALLERELRLGYSTLTVGEVLEVTKPGSGKVVGGGYRFLIDKVLPEGCEGVCVVDTDVEVDIEPLSEEQARETLRQRGSRKKMKAESEGGEVRVGEVVEGAVGKGGYVDFMVKNWDRARGVVVEVEVVDGEEVEGGKVDLLVSTSRYCREGTARPGPRIDEWVWADVGSRAVKSVSIGPGNVELVDRDGMPVEGLAISVHGYEGAEGPTAFRLSISQDDEDEEGDVEGGNQVVEPGHTLCPNCKKQIPERALMLHTNFCQRNNVLCPLRPSCGQLFKRGSKELDGHWHCPECLSPTPATTGNDKHHGGPEKHNALTHTTQTCPDCPYTCTGISPLARHRITNCPGKLILCRFCHLLVPQGDEMTELERLQTLYGRHGTSNTETLLTLTSHERDCGGRTTDCHICGKLVKLLDLPDHLHTHELARLSSPTPRICRNANCCRTIPDPGSSSSGSNGGTTQTNPLSLCPMCFGPLYAPGIYDPTNALLEKRLERKIQTNALVGCKRSGCTNLWCKTGRAEMGVPPIEGGLKGVRELVEGAGGGVRLCVDKVTAGRRVLAETLAGEEGYPVEWGVKAVESAGGEEEEARRWLGKWGVRIGE